MSRTAPLLVQKPSSMTKQEVFQLTGVHHFFRGERPVLVCWVLHPRSDRRYLTASIACKRASTTNRVNTDVNE